MTKSRSIEAGSLLQESVPQCSLCPLGYFQPAVGSLQCIQCPRYHSTVATGAKSPDQCLGKPFVATLSELKKNFAPDSTRN